jgi:hypothetical protein
MSIVYVLGAGASYGDTLRRLPYGPQHHEDGKIVPLANGFFSDETLRAVGYDIETIGNDFPKALKYVAQLFNIGNIRERNERWQNIDIESVFTSIELDKEFWSAESDYGAHCVQVRNNLLRCIFRIISKCTLGSQAENARILVENLAPDDSIISFNWDLLIDQELYSKPNRLHYNSFQKATLQFIDDDPFAERPAAGSGMFLKLHGSMNWFQCTNKKCPANQSLILDWNFQECLSRLMGMHWKDETCSRCGSNTESLIIPPLLQKPIADNWIVRSAWGLARKKLQQANVVVIIGFSAPPTDFYASWLLRSSAGLKGTPVFIVNPDHDKPEFKTKMQNIFPRGFDARFRLVSEINAVLAAAKEREFREMQVAAQNPGSL